LSPCLNQKPKKKSASKAPAITVYGSAKCGNVDQAAFLPEKDTPQAWEAAARHGLSVIELESDEDRQVAARWRQDVVNAQELFSLSSISRARLADLRKLHDGKRQHQASDNSTADTKLERVQGKCMRLSIRTRDKT